MENKVQTGTNQERKFYHGGVGEYDLPEHDLDVKKDPKPSELQKPANEDHPEDQISS